MGWLRGHINLELDPAPGAAARRLDRIRELIALLGDPQEAYPVLHLTGTNGKGSAARMLSALLEAQGLSVGTYTSPDLEGVNERLAWNGAPIADAELVEVLDAVAAAKEALGDGRGPTYFELLTAAALRWFADVAVDVAVVEVGLGGRHDATNVADGRVAVVTNVSLDHAEVIGPGLIDIAREKAGIVKPGSTLVLGETAPELAAVFHDAGAAQVWERHRDFDCPANRPAVGGRLVDLATPFGVHREVYLPVHGAHQGDNLAAALAAAEAWLGRALDEEVVSAAMAGLRLPGRLEVVGRHPLCVIDGAHNPAGARAARTAMEDELLGGLTGEGLVLVVGMLAGRDPEEMLRALGVGAGAAPGARSGAGAGAAAAAVAAGRAGRVRLVVACPAPSPRSLPAQEVAAAAAHLGAEVEVADSVPEGVARALAAAGPDEAVLVTGSLYVVGAARRVLVGRNEPASPGTLQSPAHGADAGDRQA